MSLHNYISQEVHVYSGVPTLHRCLLSFSAPHACSSFKALVQMAHSHLSQTGESKRAWGGMVDRDHNILVHLKSLRQQLVKTTEEWWIYVKAQNYIAYPIVIIIFYCSPESCGHDGTV